jgi:transcriptional regulator with XRE-family HTH domain
VYAAESLLVSHAVHDSPERGIQSPQIAFGARVRELRLMRGWTQEDLADRCGLFRTYMSRIETGAANATLTMIYALAVSLEVPVTALFEQGATELRPLKQMRIGSRGKVR